MDTLFVFSPSRSVFSLPGAWPSTDSLAETLGLPNANPPHQEPLSAVPAVSRSGEVKRRSVADATGPWSLRNSVASYDDDSDDFYSFVEAQEVKQKLSYLVAIR
jgi:hypothetical protein